jgi:hypothetical protein
MVKSAEPAAGSEKFLCAAGSIASWPRPFGQPEAQELCALASIAPCLPVRPPPACSAGAGAARCCRGAR